MRHPFQSIPPGKGKYVFVPAFVFYLVIQLIFVWLEGPLQAMSADWVKGTLPPGQTALCAPGGIVAFELARTVPCAQELVDSWGTPGQLNAAFGLGLDYLFMVAYSTVIGMACIWAAQTVAARGWALTSLGGLLAWGVWIAALFDGTENIMLLGQLFYGVASPLPEIAAICATIKFALIILGLLYMLYGVVAWFTRRAARPALV